MESKIMVIMSFVLLLFPLVLMAAEEKKIIGEYWGERAIKEMNGGHLSDQDDILLIKDFKSTPNLFLEYKDHISPKATATLEGNKIMEKYWRDGTIKEMNEGHIKNKGEDMVLVKDFKSTPNLFLEYKDHISPEVSFKYQMKWGKKEKMHHFYTSIANLLQQRQIDEMRELLLRFSKVA